VAHLTIATTHVSLYLPDSLDHALAHPIEPIELGVLRSLIPTVHFPHLTTASAHASLYLPDRGYSLDHALAHPIEPIEKGALQGLIPTVCVPHVTIATAQVPHLITIATAHASLYLSDRGNNLDHALAHPIEPVEQRTLRGLLPTARAPQLIAITTARTCSSCACAIIFT
jgi:hypothetical protein